jgi:hypothetical protein
MNPLFVAGFNRQLLSMPKSTSYKAGEKKKLSINTGYDKLIAQIPFTQAWNTSPQIKAGSIVATMIDKDLPTQRYVVGVVQHVYHQQQTLQMKPFRFWSGGIELGKEFGQPLTNREILEHRNNPQIRTTLQPKWSEIIDCFIATNQKSIHPYRIDMPHKTVVVVDDWRVAQQITKLLKEQSKLYCDQPHIKEIVENMTTTSNHSRVQRDKIVREGFERRHRAILDLKTDVLEKRIPQHLRLLLTTQRRTIDLLDLDMKQVRARLHQIETLLPDYNQKYTEIHPFVLEKTQVLTIPEKDFNWLCFQSKLPLQPIAENEAISDKYQCLNCKADIEKEENGKHLVTDCAATKEIVFEIVEKIEPLMKIQQNDGNMINYYQALQQVLDIYKTERTVEEQSEWIENSIYVQQQFAIVTLIKRIIHNTTTKWIFVKEERLEKHTKQLLLRYVKERILKKLKLECLAYKKKIRPDSWINNLDIDTLLAIRAIT